MLYGAQVAVGSELITKQIKAVWAERMLLNVKPVGASCESRL